MEDITSFLYNKNSMLVLSYLTKNIYEENTITSISKELEISVGSVHSILKKFEGFGFVKTRTLGKNIIYNLEPNNPIIKPFRIFDNINSMNAIIQKIKPVSRKIILFGSCSRGEDTESSDIDIFILTDDEKEKITSILDKENFKRQINPIIVNTVEFMELENNDKVFFEEIMKGIILWEV